MSLTRNGVPSSDKQDPIGFAVSLLNRLAQTTVLDRLGLRKQTERVVFETTRAGFRTVGAVNRSFSRKGRPGAKPVRVPSAAAKGLFDLTPTEEFASEMVRPAAAEADDACAAPEELLKSSLEIGLPILGVPEELEGISTERSAMAGTLVAEALSKGDMGLAVACLGATSSSRRTFRHSPAGTSRPPRSP
jgi:hypothetical protein